MRIIRHSHRAVGTDLALLATNDDLTVAVLSGRSLAGLRQFDFDDQLEVWGSYGAERRGHASVDLTHVEASRLRSLDALLSKSRSASVVTALGSNANRRVLWCTFAKQTLAAVARHWTGRCSSSAN